MVELHASLQSSLRRSLSLGLDVLQRASSRRLDWAQSRDATHDLNNSSKREEAPAEIQQRSGMELKEAFVSISRFMAHTSLHCQRFYGSSCSLSDSDRKHVRRFHSCSSAETTPGARSERTQFSEDFYIELSPGTYSITASTTESPQQQTQLVTLGDGQSINLTFEL